MTEGGLLSDSMQHNSESPWIDGVISSAFHTEPFHTLKGTATPLGGPPVPPPTVPCCPTTTTTSIHPPAKPGRIMRESM